MVVPLSATDEDILNTEIQVLISRKKQISFEKSKQIFCFHEKKISDGESLQQSQRPKKRFNWTSKSQIVT